MRTQATALLLAFLGSALAARARAQGYLVRLDTRAQAVQYRGVTADSVLATDTVTSSTGGPVTSDGYAVSCLSGSAYCSFYRAGPILSGAPVTTTADISLWGFGIPGLSFRATARMGSSIGNATAWPGVEPATQLLEGYAQYATEHLSVQVGRQSMSSRLGFMGFDGGMVTLRDPQRGLDLIGYGGWGLTDGDVLPVTSPTTNPLDNFQPPDRQLVAGAQAGWTSTRVDIRANYLREVDPSVDYFVSERAGLDVSIRPHRDWTLTGGADYDLAEEFWGSAEATLSYLAANGRGYASLGIRSYRPHFDLWTIWGAFSPVPYHAVDATASFSPIDRLRLRANGEHYAYDDAGVSTPLVSFETTGWRFGWGATVTVAPQWMLDGGYHAEFGPGASSRGFEGAVTFTKHSLTLSAQAGTVDVPLEFRFDDASVWQYGVSAQWRTSSRVNVGLDASRYVEDRQRPDAAAFDWNQVWIDARVSLLLGGGAGSASDLQHLPSAVRRMPGGREAP
ncbi:MAG TPA: hypothetical protein VN848_12900 [Gemmatimonadales bacterium]|nr:hypothetical protein [Gemmatimonadales bacterium]